MSDDVVLVDIDRRVATVTFNRPLKRNAMNPALNVKMLEVLDARPMRALGLSSYSLYLTHVPIVVLVYEKMPDGSFQLNGVEFLVPISAWKSTEPPRIMGQNLVKVDSIGFWFLHVWTWKPDPSGLFAPWNPDVKCRPADCDRGQSSLHWSFYGRRVPAHPLQTICRQYS